MREIFFTLFPDWPSLEVVIEAIEDNKEKGDTFEEFVYFYFTYFKDLYQIKELYANVIPERKIPRTIREKYKIEDADIGIDGINILTDDVAVAWQAKFRSGRTSPTIRELSTFWTEAENTEFRCVVSNADCLPSVTDKKKGHQQILIDKFLELDAAFFEALYQFALGNRPAPKKIASRRDYQEEAVQKIAQGLQSESRGKYIAACGTGKTLVSLWITEDMGSETVLVLAPSLALIRQTLQVWATNKSLPFNYLCVCSDQTIDEGLGCLTYLDVEEIDIPVSTDPSNVVKFLNDFSGRKVIFCTYQSLDVISTAMKSLGSFSFDCAVFDEAHRTAGLGGTGAFAIALDDARVPIKKRLFMTATERLVTPRVKTMAARSGQTIMSMDDPVLYGPVLHRLNFGDAISKGIISDYRIVLAGIGAGEVYELIKQNRYVQTTVGGRAGATFAAQDLYKELLLLKAIQQLAIKKTITFHSRISNAIEFVDVLKQIGPSLGSQAQASVFIGSVNGSMPSAKRVEIIKEFEQSDLGILANVHCLSEGVDIPVIDAVYFADSKDSLIEIVQAVGRALRQPYGTKGKIANIIIPVLIPNSTTDLDMVGEEFETLYNVIQAVRGQDAELDEWINELNLAVAKGTKTFSHGISGRNKFTFILPKNVSLSDFGDQLYLNIADVTGNPEGTYAGWGALGKGQRGGKTPTVLKPIADMNWDVIESLVAPTIGKYARLGEMHTRAELEYTSNGHVSHNNVATAERLDLIVKDDNGRYRLTDMGDRLRRGDIAFLDYFRGYLLNYSIDDKGAPVYPYRVLLEILRRSGTLSYIEYLYGPNLITSSQNMQSQIDKAVGRIEQIREAYPDIEVTSIANQDAVMEDLNNMFGSGFEKKDVWSDRQTYGNRYRYFRNHLSVYGDVLNASKNTRKEPISLKEGGEERMNELLSK